MLGIIEKSLFVLILDDATPDVDAEVLNSNIGENYKNRWADKSMNIIIYKNGRIGTLSDVSSRRRADKVLFPHPRPHSSGKNEKFFYVIQHTAFDGIVALGCLNFVVASIDENKKEKSNRKNTQSVTMDEMIFDLDDRLIEEINCVEIDTAVYVSLTFFFCFDTTTMTWKEMKY